MSYASVKVCPNTGCYMFSPNAVRVCPFCKWEFYPKKVKNDPKPVPQ
jgi:hypothetical protein